MDGDENSDISVTMDESNSKLSRSDSTPILNSSNLPESEKRYFKSIFEKYDKDGNGVMDAKELAEMLRENQEVTDKIVTKLIIYSDTNNDGKIDVDEFTNMVLEKKFKALFGHYVKSYVDFVVPRDKRRRFRRIGRSVGTSPESGNVEVDGAYEDGWSCWPPPACMILVSILEIICFVLNECIQDKESIKNGFGPVARQLIYDPQRRNEFYRYLTYMFVHIGWMHITMNLLTQIFLGLALELRNRWYRVLGVYIAGVVAGSLVTSIMDPAVYLAGASGGVYAIITAHLSNIIINWNEMTYPSLQLFVFLTLIFADVGTAVYNRYHLGVQTPIGYAAHFGGALAGFLVGIWALKNVQPTRKENYLWWAALILYALLMGTAILLNIFWTDHFTKF